MPPRLAALALGLGAATAAGGILWGPTDSQVAGVALAISLSWASFVDVDRLILPDAITLGLVAAGLLLRIASGFDATLPFAIGALVGFSLLGLAALAYRRVRGRAGLGMGDAKLLAAGGAWLGWAAIPTVLLAAAGSALIFAVVVGVLRGRLDSQARIPFGPFIAAAIWLVWLFGPLTFLTAQEP